MTTYAAFLRGINVGGHRAMQMKPLSRAFASLGFKDVRTLLASGNVLFSAPPASRVGLVRKIEEKLEETFGSEISVILRSVEE